MKPGAVKMRYPSGDPENGPAYLQQWTGTEWQCLVHKPRQNKEESQEVFCGQCGITLVSEKEVKAMIKRGRK